MKFRARVGLTVKATRSDAVSAKLTVKGRYHMKSPTTPGQANSGEKAAKVVSVENRIAEPTCLVARSVAR